MISLKNSVRPLLYTPYELISALLSPGGAGVKESAYNAGDNRFDPWVGKISWSRKWQPTLVLLPGKFYGQRSLAGHSSWGHKESNTTEHAHVYSESKPDPMTRA